jgi:hypothetical protein
VRFAAHLALARMTKSKGGNDKGMTKELGKA